MLKELFGDHQHGLNPYNGEELNAKITQRYRNGQLLAFRGNIGYNCVKRFKYIFGVIYSDYSALAYGIIMNKVQV